MNTQSAENIRYPPQSKHQLLQVVKRLAQINIHAEQINVNVNVVSPITGVPVNQVCDNDQDFDDITKFINSFFIEGVCQQLIGLANIIVQFTLYGSITAAILRIINLGLCLLSFVLLCFNKKCKRSYLNMIIIILFIGSFILGLTALIIAGTHPVLYSYYSNVSVEYRTYNNENRLLQTETEYNNCIIFFNNLSQQEYEQQYSAKCDPILGLSSNSIFTYKDCLILYESLPESEYQTLYSLDCDLILGNKNSPSESEENQKKCQQLYDQLSYIDYLKNYSSFCDPILGVDSQENLDYESCFDLYLTYSYKAYELQYGKKCDDILGLPANATTPLEYFDNSCVDQGQYDMKKNYCYQLQIWMMVMFSFDQFIQLILMVHILLKMTQKRVKQNQVAQDLKENF